MSISPNDPKLTAYILGELDPAEHEGLRLQIENSAELQNVIAEISEVADLVSSTLGTKSSVGLADHQRESLFAECEQEQTEKSVAPPDRALGGFFVRHRNWVIAASLAGAVLVGMGTFGPGYLLNRHTKLAGGQKVEELGNHQRQVTLENPRPAYEHQVSSSGIVGRDSPEFGDIQQELLQSAIQKQRLEMEEARSGDIAAREQANQLYERTLDANRATLDKQMQLMKQQTNESFGISVDDSKLVTDTSAASILPANETSLPANETSKKQIIFTENFIENTPFSSPTAAPIAGPTGSPSPRFPENSTTSRPVDGIRTAEGLGTTATRNPNSAVSASGPHPDATIGDLPRDEFGGHGPGRGGDKFSSIEDNPFCKVIDHPLSTFSIDVDTASYSKVRMYLNEHHRLPPAGSVRIEELVNYFTYDYAGPTDDRPFASQIEVAGCPWTPKHRIVRVGIKGKEIESKKRPHSNLVFLLDVSGSMDQPNKLPLLKRGMKRLVDELGENDRVAIVVYAGAAGLVLPSTHGDQKQQILDSLNQLRVGGSTNGGQGIQLAYQTALDNFIEGGTNRVILCTDGDFNVGTTSTSDLVDLVSKNSKDGIFISVLGYGIGNHNDAMLEQISNKGNGNYAFIDTDAESKKVLVEQLSGTLVTIAKDVKIQIEFNPAQVAAYRLIGYENRILAAQDFNDDKKDAGEIGAGHTVTALYQIVPKSAEADITVPPVDELKYQQKSKLSEEAPTDELLTLKIRYKEPAEDKSKLLTFPVKDEKKSFAQASNDFKFATSVAGFGMLLRNSPHKGEATFDAADEIASSVINSDSSEYRREFLELIRAAKQISGQ